MRVASGGPAARGARSALLLALLCLAAARFLAADDENLSPAGNEYMTCFRERDRRLGMCVSYLQCDDNQSLARGGNIVLYEVRDGTAPLESCGRNLWCCADDSGSPAQPGPDATTGTTSLANPGNCLRAADDCPWCVALYRPGGDVDRGQTTQSGLYCGGALLGPRVVLTSAGCIITVGEESVWARVPASAAPSRRYAVADRFRHEHYNSGNGKNDFGLMVLKESVEFATNPFSACVSFAQLPATGCRAVGFGRDEQIVPTPVSLRDGDCPPRNRSIPDLVCATPVGTGPCAISPGAPVLCPAGDAQGGLALAGVVRRRCRLGAAHLGKLHPHADWLRLQLRRLGVPASQHEP